MKPARFLFVRLSVGLLVQLVVDVDSQDKLALPEVSHHFFDLIYLQVHESSQTTPQNHP